MCPCSVLKEVESVVTHSWTKVWVFLLLMLLPGLLGLVGLLCLFKELVAAGGSSS